jgi:BirA family transcriptional regulator, biotin operon repressor / biotin---[acetyl-CoA-carboxylase] ligase
MQDIAQLILNELKKNEGHLSGEALAAKFKMSRQALSKHICKLEEQGYEIVAVPHLGYKLTALPDKLLPAEVHPALKTKYLGNELHYYAAIDSTQNACAHLGLHEAQEGTVVVSETQAAGRGRMGRSWVSSLGGIYFSLLLRPVFLPVVEAPKITMLISLAVRNAIFKAAGIDCAVKWPNDVYLGGKKVAGILCEINAEVDKINFVVVGVGINVNSRDLPPVATSLFLYGKDKIKRKELFVAILSEIENYYEAAKKHGFKSILEEWQKYCPMLGKEVEVKTAARTIKGKAVTIDEYGRLVLKEGSRSIKISSGDVVKVYAR